MQTELSFSFILQKKNRIIFIYLTIYIAWNRVFEINEQNKKIYINQLNARLYYGGTRIH